jgi:hypothetical protein
MNPKLLSKEKPIPQTVYGEIPEELWKNKRDVAHEEACRDLDKSPEQLLVDAHDESLDKNRLPHETIARTIVRVASMQLRIEKQSESLNQKVFWFGLIGVLLAFVGTFASVIQAWYTVYPPK